MTSQMSTIKSRGDGGFAAQLTENSTFLSVERDKVIKMTLNKGTKVIMFLIKNKFKR